jgi:hypothetical protein
MDNLEHRLEQQEARLRETRLLLEQQKHRRAATPEATLALAANLFQALSEVDALAETLNQKLKEDSEKRTRAIRERQYGKSGWHPAEPTTADKTNFGSEKLYGEDDEGAAGNAPVIAFPKGPVPVLSGGAARRIEESYELARNP